MSDAPKLDLPAVMQELEEALRELESVRDEMQLLRREETKALNRVNAAQKAFDAQIGTVKTRCGLSGTDWARPRETVGLP